MASQATQKKIIVAVDFGKLQNNYTILRLISCHRDYILRPGVGTYNQEGMLTSPEGHAVRVSKQVIEKNCGTALAKCKRKS